MSKRLRAPELFLVLSDCLQSALNNRDCGQLQYFRERSEKHDHDPMTKWSSLFINRSIDLENHFRGRVNDAVESLRLELVDTCEQLSYG